MGEFPLAQRVRYLVVSLQRPKSMLWRRFNPWPENFHMSQAQPKFFFLPFLGLHPRHMEVPRQGV